MISKTLYLVVGCHRSGTSATAGTLYHLGLNFGAEDRMMPPTEHNPKGYYEHLDFVEFNDKVLKSMDCTWDSVDNLNETKMLEDKHQFDLTTLLMKEFNDNDHFTVKDPRISLLLPLYYKVCERMGIRVDSIYVWRSLRSIAHSLMDRDGFDSDKAIGLVRSYKDNIEINLKTVYLNISYDSLINQTKKTVVTLSLFTGKGRDKIQKACEFVDPSLKHF